MPTARLSWVSWLVSFPVPPRTYGDTRFSREPAWRDQVYGGRYRIRHSVSLPGNVPVEAKVWLFDRHSGRHLRSTMSGADGIYEFNWLRGDREYLTYALYPTGERNAAIADRPPLELMP